MNLLTISRFLLFCMLFSIRVMAATPIAWVADSMAAQAPSVSADPVTASPVAGPDFSADLALYSADPANAELLARLVLHAVEKGQWGLLVSLLLTGVIAFLRKFTPAESKVGVWLRSKLGGIVTSFGLALGGAFAAQFLAGAPFGWALILKAVSVALGASGSWAIFKNVKEAIDESKAQKAGLAAAAEPVKTLDK